MTRDDADPSNYPDPDREPQTGVGIRFLMRWAAGQGDALTEAAYREMAAEVRRIEVAGARFRKRPRRTC